MTWYTWYFLGDIKECKDQADDCEVLADGACQRLPDYMMQNCKKTCDFCGPESSMFYFKYAKKPFLRFFDLNFNSRL